MISDLRRRRPGRRRDPRGPGRSQVTDADRYSQLVNAPVVSTVAKQVGLPQPVDLDRYQPGAPVVAGPVLSGAAPGGRLEQRARSRSSTSIGAERAGAEGKAKALVFDATGIADSTELVELQRFFYPAVGAPAAQRPGRRPRHPAGAGRLGPRPHRAAGAGGLHPLARQGDRRPGATAQLVYVEPGAEDQLDSTLRFLLSPRSAYVYGQVIRIGKGVAADAGDRLGRARWPARRRW